MLRFWDWFLDEKSDDIDEQLEKEGFPDKPENFNVEDFEQGENSSVVQRFFKNYLAPFVKTFRILLIVIFVAVTGYNIYATSLIRKTTNPEAILKPDNSLQKINEWKMNELWRDTTIAGIRFHWGVESELVAGPDSDFWFAAESGKVKLDEDFKPELPTLQQAIYEFQLALKNDEKYFNVVTPLADFHDYLL